MLSKKLNLPKTCFTTEMTYNFFKCHKIEIWDKKREKRGRKRETKQKDVRHAFKIDTIFPEIKCI